MKLRIAIVMLLFITAFAIVAQPCRAELRGTLHMYGVDVDGNSSSGACDANDPGSGVLDLYYLISVADSVAQAWNHSWTCTYCSDSNCNCNWGDTVDATLTPKGRAYFDIHIIDSDSGDEDRIADHRVSVPNGPVDCTGGCAANFAAPNIAATFCDNTYQDSFAAASIRFYTFYNDTDGPSSLTSPTFGAGETQVASKWYSTDSTISIGWSSGDDVHSGETYEISITEAPSGSVIFTGETGCDIAKSISFCSAASGCTFNNVSLSSGNTYSIQLRAKNGCNPQFRASEQSMSAWLTWPNIKIDTTGPRPRVADTKPVDWQGTSYPLTIFCGDAPSPCSENSVPDAPNSNCQNAGCDSSTYAVLLQDTPGACPTVFGSYTVIGTASTAVSSHKYACTAAKDILGQVGFSASAEEIYVDNIAPTMTINGAPGSWQNTAASLSAGCSDTLSGCDTSSYYITILDTHPGTCDAAPGYFYMGTGSLSADYHRYACVKGSDLATISDNTGYSPVVELLVDVNVPSSVTVSGAPASWQNTDATAVVNCTDDSQYLGGSGCKSSSYRVKYTATSGACPTDYTQYTNSTTVSSHTWVCAAASDNVGNWAYSSTAVEFKVDKTAPTTTITGMPGAWQNTDAMVTANCSDTGDSACNASSYRLAATGTNDPGSCPTNYSSYSMTSPAVASIYQWYCSAVKDTAGNVGISALAYPFWVDKIAPAVNTPEIYSANKFGSYYSGSLLNLRASASDTGVSNLNTSTCYYSIDNGSTYLPASWDGTYCYVTNAPVTGDINVVFKINDVAGNTGTSSASSYTQDNVGSFISVTGMPASWQNTDATANVNCVDAASGCASADYRILVYTSDPGICPTTYASYLSPDATAISAHSWVCAAAKDNVHNEGYSAPEEFLVDKTAPVASVSGAPATWLNSDATATVSCSDTGDSICDTSSYKILTYASDPGTCLADYSQYTLLSPQTITDHSWVCGAVKDVAQNVATSSPIEYFIDKTPPVINAPEIYSSNVFAAFFNSGAVDLRAQASDGTGSGLDTSTCEYSINNGSSYSAATWSAPYCIKQFVNVTGQINVLFKISDTAGNQVTSAVTQYTEDNDAPTSTVDALPQYQTSGSFGVNWTGDDGVGAGVKDYDVEYKAGLAGAWLAWKVDFTGAGDTFTGGADGTTYYFRSAASDNLGNPEAMPSGDGDASTMVDTSFPQSSVFGLASWQTSLSFLVNWSGTDLSPGSGFKDFTIQYRQGAAGTWADWKTNTTDTTDTFTGVDGTEYFFRSSALDNAGNQEAYPGGDGDTSTQIDVSAPVTSVDALPAFTGSTAFAIGWTGTDGVGSGILNYDIQFRDGSAGVWTDLLTDTTSSAYTFTGLDGHTYHFQSCAEDNLGNVEAMPGGDGDTSTTVDVTAPVSAVDAQGSYQTSTSFNVSWSGDDGTVGSGISTYDVQYRQGAAGVWMAWLTDTALTSSSFPLGMDGQVFYFQVRAEDAVGNIETYPGGDGDTSTLVDVSPPVTAVTALSPYQAQTIFTVNWSGTDVAGIKQYDVQYRDGAAGVWTDWKTATTDTSADFTGVDNGTYFFRSRAEDLAGNVEAYPGGDGDTSTIIDTTILPGPAAVNDGAGADEEFTTSTNSLSANWTAVTGAARYVYGIGTSPISPDVLGWQDNGLSLSASPGGLSLAEGVEYFFIVEAQNPAGVDGQWTVSNGITVDTTPPACSVTALPAYVGTETFTVSWSATDAGSGVKNYDIQYKEETGGAWTDWQVDSTSLSANFTGVDDVSYFFQCRAEDNLGNLEIVPGGDGDAGTTLDTTVLAAPVVDDGLSGDVAFTLSNNSLDASWPAITGAGSYWYGVGLATDTPSLIGWTDNGTATSVTISGLTLTEGQTYYVFVKAKTLADVHGVAGFSDGVSIDTTAPTSSVVSLASHNGATNFTVNWTGTDAGGSGITGYDLQFRDGASGIWTDWFTNTLTQSSTFTGVDGHTYYFRSRATDGLGLVEDYPSGLGDTNITVDTSAPSAMVAALSDYKISGSFMISWGGSDGAVGSGIKQYDIQYRDGATGTWNNWLTDTTQAEAAFTLGEHLHTYYFQVRAEDNVGNVSVYAGGDGDTSTTVDTEPPTAEMIALIEYQSTEEFPVQWSGDDAAGSGIVSYDVQVKDVEEGSGLWNAVWTDWLLGVTQSEAIYPGQDGHTYYFQVRAKDVAGNSSAYTGGNGYTFTTVDTSLLPGPSYIYDSTGQDIDSVNATDTLSANWAQVPGAAKYFYGLGSTTEGPDVISWTDNSEATTVTIDSLSLDEGVRYYFFVRAENFSGLQGIKGRSDGVVIDTIAPVCTVSQLLTYNPSEIFEVSWSATDGTVGSGAVAYDIRYKKGTTGAWTSWIDDTSQTSSIFSGEDQTTYYLECSATDAAGNGETFASADGEASTTVDTTIPEAPNFVNDGAGEDIDYSMSTDTLAANWQGVENGAAYEYSVSTAGGVSFIQWTDNGAETSFELTGLELAPGTKYVVKVRGLNKAGIIGPEAVSDGVTIDNTPPTAPVVSCDGKTTNDPTKLHATWSAEDSETPITEYKYAIGTTPGGEEVISYLSANAADEVTHSSLTLENNQTYYFSVKAKNSVDLWSEPGISEGITYRMTHVAVEVTYLPQQITIAPDGDKTVTYEFNISGNSGLSIDREKVIVELPSRDYEQRDDEVDIKVSLENPTLSIYRTIAFEEAIAMEALAGGQSATVNVKRIFTGYDDEMNEVEVSIIVPVTIETTMGVTEMLEVTEAAITVSDSIELDSRSYPKLELTSSGIANQVRGRIIYSDNRIVPISLIAKGGGKKESFKLPALDTTEVGVHQIRAVIDSPAYLETGVIEYKVVVPQLDYDVQEISIVSAMDRVIQGDRLVGTVGIKVSGEGGKVKGVAVLDGEDWQFFELDLPGDGEVTYFDSPQLPSGAEGKHEFSIRLTYPDKVESEPFRYQVVQSKFMVPDQLPLPHPLVALLQLKDKSGNVRASTSQDKEGVKIWSGPGNPLKVSIPALGTDKSFDALVSEEIPLVYSYEGVYTDVGSWRYLGGEAEVAADEITLEFEVLGKLTLKKKPGQSAPIIKLGKAGIVLNGVGAGKGISKANFINLTINAASPPRITGGQGIIEVDGGAVVLTNEHENSPLTIGFREEAETDDGVLLSAVTGITAELILDKDGLHFPSGSWPVDFSYSYGEYRFSDEISVRFEDLVLDVYADSDESRVKSGRAVFITGDEQPVELASTDATAGFELRPEFWSLMIAGMIPDMLPLPDTDIMYVRLRNTNGDPIVDLDLTKADSFSQALKFKVWSKPGTPLELYIPALKIDENNEDDMDRPLELLIARDSPLQLSCSPDCSTPENWRIEKGDIDFPQLPPIPFAGVVLNLKGLAFDPFKKEVQIAGTVDYTLGENNVLASVDFDQLRLTRYGVSGTVDIENDLPESFSYDKTDFTLEKGIIFFQSMTMHDYMQAMSNKAAGQAEEIRVRIASIAGRKKELARKKQRYSEDLESLLNEKSRIEQAVTMMDSNSTVMAAGERIESLEMQISMIESDISGIDDALRNGDRKKTEYESELQRLSDGAPLSGSSPDEGMTVVNIFNVEGRITRLPLFGDLGSNPVEFGGFTLLFDPLDKYVGKITGAVTLGDASWYSDNAGAVLRDGGAISGNAIFTSQAWNGDIDFSIYSAYMKFSDNELSDAGFAGGLAYHPDSAVASVNTVMTISLDASTGIIQGNSMLPNLLPVKFTGMEVDFDSGFSEISYNMNTDSTEINFYGLAGMLKALPEPMGSFEVPVQFSNAVINENGFTGIFSNLASNMPLKTFNIFDSGTDRASVDLTAVNIFIKDNAIARGSLSATLFWDRGTELFEFGGTLDYKQDGSISGEIGGLDLTPFKVDDLAWVDINNGALKFSIAEAGNQYEVSGLEGDFITFPFAHEYDYESNSISFNECAWDDSGFDCTVVYNSDENCGFTGGQDLFVEPLFTDEESNPEFDMDLHINGACGIIEDGRIKDFRAQADVKLIHNDSVKAGKELYSGKVELLLNRETEPMLTGVLNNISVENIEHYGFAMKVTNGQVNVELTKSFAKGSFDKLQGGITALPGVSGMDANPIAASDFSISLNGLSGFVETQSETQYDAQLHDVPVKLDITKLRFSPKAFALNATVKIPQSSRDSLPEEVGNVLEDSCFEAELQLSNAGFLYSTPLEINYGQFTNELSCGKDISLSMDGFTGGYVYALPPIPMPGIKTAFMIPKTAIVLQQSGNVARGIIRNTTVDIHLPLTDTSFPTGLQEAVQYIQENPDSHRVISVAVDGEINIQCDIDSNDSATACRIESITGGAGIATELDPPLVIQRGDYSVELSSLEYGIGNVCGATQSYMAVDAEVTSLPGVGELEQAVSFTPYLTEAGLCGTKEVDLPEFDLDGFGLDITGAVIELATSEEGQSFIVRDIEGSVMSAPGFDLSGNPAQFTGSITNETYNFSFLQDGLDLANPLMNMSLKIQKLSAELTPENSRLKMYGAFALPEGMAYNGDPIAADMWAEKSDDTVEYAAESINMRDVSIRVFGMADMVINSAYLREGVNAQTVVSLYEADLKFTAEGLDHSIPISGLDLSSRRLRKIQLDINYGERFGFFSFKIGKLAFVNPIASDPYLTFTGLIQFDLPSENPEDVEEEVTTTTNPLNNESGEFDKSKETVVSAEGGRDRWAIKAEVAHLNAFKVYADDSIEVGGLAIDLDTPMFRVAGSLYLMDFENDDKINVIQSVCDACESAIGDNLYLQDSDEKKDFAGDVILEVKELFEFQAAAAFLSDGSFGIFLSVPFGDPGIPIGGPVSLSNVMGGIMSQQQPTPLFALSIGGGLTITGTEKLVKGKGAVTVAFGEPTMINLCACISVGNIGDDPVCEVGGSASIFLSSPTGFLGTFNAACKVPPKTGSLLDLNAELNLCFREPGGCYFSHDDSSVIKKCMGTVAKREEYVNFEGTARILSLVDAGLAFAITKNYGADFGARVIWEGELGDTDIIGVWYYLVGEVNLCRIGVTGMWGRVMLGGGAGVSVIGIDIFTIDIAAELAFYSDPFRFVGKMGGGACIGLGCGREVCEGCLTGGCCPHNPGQIRSVSCGKESSCAGVGFFRVGGCLSFQISFGEEV